MKNKLAEIFNFAEREKKKRQLKRLRGGDAEPIEEDAEIDLFCPKHGMQRIEHCRFERHSKSTNEEGDSLIFGRSKDHENPLRFFLLGDEESSIKSEMYSVPYTQSSEGSKRLAIFLATIGISIIIFQQIWLLLGIEVGEAFYESLMFNRMLFILIGATACGGAVLYWFSNRTNYHYLPLVCTGEHEGNIHTVTVPGRESFQDAMAMFYDSEKNKDAIELFNNIQQNFDEKIEDLNDEIDEQKILREEQMEQNLMRQGMQTARALRQDLDEDFMTVKDVALYSILAAVSTGLIVYLAMG